MGPQGDTLAMLIVGSLLLCIEQFFYFFIELYSFYNEMIFRISGVYTA